MDRVFAVTALLLLQPAPHLCRRLPSPDLSTNTVRSGHHASSPDRYGLLPTPNIAAPLASPPLIASTPPLINPHLLSEPGLNLQATTLTRKPASVSVSSASIAGLDLPIDSLIPHKRRRKILTSALYNDEGKLWTKFPKKKHLVEIVPLRRKTKIAKGKGNALAYTLPKSEIVKKKLKKKHIFNNSIPEMSESSEENSSVSDSSDQKDSSDSQNSSSIESNSIEYYDAKAHHTSTHHYNKLEEPHNTASEDLINSKINDLVQYLKQHNDGALHKFVHDIVPDTEDPDLHVHYIIHKKHHPHKHNLGSIEKSDDTGPSVGVNHKYHARETNTDENVVHRVPLETFISEDVSDEHNMKHGSSIVAVTSNHINKPHHHKKTDSTENSEYRDVHFVLENTNEGPVLLPNVITENVKPYPEIIIHSPKLPDPHDVQHYISESDIVPEYIPYIPDHEVVESGHNLISHIYPDIQRPGHKLINHVDPEIDGPYFHEYNYIINVQNPDGSAREAIATLNNNNHDPIILDDKDNRGNDGLVVVEPSDSISDSSKTESAEDSSSATSDQSSANNTEFGPDANASKPKDKSTESSGSSSFSDSRFKSDETVENSNTNEESTEIHDGIFSNVLLTAEDISPDTHSTDNTAVTSEEISASKENEIEHVIQTQDNSDESPENGLVRHIKILPDCVKLKKHNKNCNRQKIYKLTFLFNR